MATNDRLEDMMPTKNLRFPEPATPAKGCAGWATVIRERCRHAIIRALHRVGIPGAVRPMAVADELTGQRLTITVDPLFTRISVDGRDYFFNRLSGRFDGTGMGCG